MIPIHELMIGSLFLYPDKEVWQKVHSIDKSLWQSPYFYSFAIVGRDNNRCSHAR